MNLITGAKKLAEVMQANSAISEEALDWGKKILKNFLRLIFTRSLTKQEKCEAMEATLQELSKVATSMKKHYPNLYVHKLELQKEAWRFAEFLPVHSKHNVWQGVVMLVTQANRAAFSWQYLGKECNEDMRADMIFKQIFHLFAFQVIFGGAKSNMAHQIVRIVKNDVNCETDRQFILDIIKKDYTFENVAAKFENLSHTEKPKFSHEEVD
ncbi:hypothetical protein Ciccas_008783 [Cichlidogyrus casuarinus]|uniref:Uncharacterized protein n=1 Tax=Cichlidogyrus casuarinus TaxID=1844966 RepID=A0ABD2Q0K3_9PLAT